MLGYKRRGETVEKVSLSKIKIVLGQDYVHMGKKLTPVSHYIQNLISDYSKSNCEKRIIKYLEVNIEDYLIYKFQC